ncbi:MAG: tripartite tricarboxylate transporter TctB family protein [Candidatus Limiplasma sp.]|nr:tripartite tricarboxylate transporter TctB family protein [Candidatus Limiplasma sp.]
MNSSKRSYQDLLAGIVTMVMAAFLFLITFGTKSFTTGSIKADTIPKVVACAMLALGIGIILKWLRDGRRVQPAEEMSAVEQKEQTETDPRRKTFQKITTPLTLAFIFLYILAMDQIGFILSTLLFLTAQITLLSTDLSLKSVLKSALIAAIAAVLIFLVFGKAFSLPLPVNDFGF